MFKCFVPVLIAAISSDYVINGAWASREEVDALEKINAASQICETYNFSTEKEECLSIFRNAIYFSQKAVDVCARMNISSNKTSCLKSILNKYYLDLDVKACETTLGDASRIKCFEEKGRELKKKDAVLKTEFFSVEYSVLRPL